MNTPDNRSITRLFHLPPQGIFEPNGTDDPLPYYYKPLIGTLYRERIEAGLALLSPPYERILEIGFGSGIVLPSLCSLGTEVCGIDLNSKVDTVLASLSRLDCHCNLFQGDVASADFLPESFDLIVAFSIFEHIHDLKPLVEQLADCLRPGGHLLVGMPRVDRFMEKAFRVIGFSGIEEHHVSDYIQCQNACEHHFTRIGMSWLPRVLPERFGLYYNMLFEKS